MYDMLMIEIDSAFSVLIVHCETENERIAFYILEHILDQGQDIRSTRLDVPSSNNLYDRWTTLAGP